MRKFLILAALLCAFHPSFASAEVVFGVAANRGEAVAREQWTDIADLLSKELGTPVKLSPVPIEASIQAFGEKKVDFLFANPQICATVQEKTGAKPLATRDSGQGVKFGGVIIANKDSGIETLDDLRGKKLMTYTRDSAGAYLFQAYEMFKAGLDINTDMEKVVVAKKQDDVVFAVKAGEFDAGFVRTGLLETLVKEGKVSMEDFIIVNKIDDGFADVHSTPLYPEWGIVAQTEVDPAVTKKVSDFLLSLKGDNPAAQKAGIVGFVPPEDLSPLVDVMKALRVPPFDN